MEFAGLLFCPLEQPLLWNFTEVQTPIAVTDKRTRPYMHYITIMSSVAYVHLSKRYQSAFGHVFVTVAFL